MYTCLQMVMNDKEGSFLHVSSAILNRLGGRFHHIYHGGIISFTYHSSQVGKKAHNPLVYEGHAARQQMTADDIGQPCCRNSFLPINLSCIGIAGDILTSIRNFRLTCVR
jgi:hypothetical protein